MGVVIGLCHALRQAHIFGSAHGLIAPPVCNDPVSHSHSRITEVYTPAHVMICVQRARFDVQEVLQYPGQAATNTMKTRRDLPHVSDRPEVLES